jgi:hypothetical protein
MTTRPLALFSLLLATVLCVPRPTPGCAVVNPSGRSGEPIAIAHESAIILWDAASKTQHFIRRASFANTSGVKDFGFLVPTPSYPELAEASDAAFTTLEKVTAPRTVTERRPVRLFPFGYFTMSSSLNGGGKGVQAVPEQPDVQVLQQKRVAGYDAVVLEVKNADALSGWLKEHGYAFAPELKDWVAPYVRQGWKVTAFKVGRNEKGGELATSPVRMTFPTDKPFFPYREPAKQPGRPGRLLRVYFLAEARYKGVLPGAAWPGQVAWANQVGGAVRAALLRHAGLPAETGPAKWWLTEFEDYSSPRPGKADVSFERDENQQTRERSPHVIYTEPSLGDYLLAFLTQGACYYVPLLLLGLLFWLEWRRRPGRRSERFSWAAVRASGSPPPDAPPAAGAGPDKP